MLPQYLHMKLMTNSPFSQKMVPVSLAVVQKAVSNQNLCRESYLKTEFFSYFLRKFDGQFPFVTKESKTPVSSLCPLSGKEANQALVERKAKDHRNG